MMNIVRTMLQAVEKVTASVSHPNHPAKTGHGY
jgi:hypothetical protein